MVMYNIMILFFDDFDYIRILPKYDILNVKSSFSLAEVNTSSLLCCCHSCISFFNCVIKPTNEEISEKFQLLVMNNTNESHDHCAFPSDFSSQ